MRFRLSLQVSNVKRLIESPRNVWMTAHLPEEVRRFRESYPYGWQVAGTTLANLFREHGIDWDDEDEEKVSARAHADPDALGRLVLARVVAGSRQGGHAPGAPAAHGPPGAHHELRAAVAQADARGAVRRGAQAQPVVAGPADVRRLLTPCAVAHHA